MPSRVFRSSLLPLCCQGHHSDGELYTFQYILSNLSLFHYWKKEDTKDTNAMGQSCQDQHGFSVKIWIKTVLQLPRGCFCMCPVSHFVCRLLPLWAEWSVIWRWAYLTISFLFAVGCCATFINGYNPCSYQYLGCFCILCVTCIKYS